MVALAPRLGPFGRDVCGVAVRGVGLDQLVHPLNAWVTPPSQAHSNEARAYGELKRAALLDGDSDNEKYMATKTLWLWPRIEAALKEFAGAV